MTITSQAAAQRFGLADSVGRLEPGGVASFVLVDPNAEWTVDPAASESKAKWTPFAGMRFKGCVAQTWLRGRKVYDRTEGGLLGEPQGRRLPIAR